MLKLIAWMSKFFAALLLFLSVLHNYFDKIIFKSVSIAEFLDQQYRSFRVVYMYLNSILIIIFTLFYYSFFSNRSKGFFSGIRKISRSFTRSILKAYSAGTVRNSLQIFVRVARDAYMRKWRLGGKFLGAIVSTKKNFQHVLSYSISPCSDLHSFHLLKETGDTKKNRILFTDCVWFLLRIEMRKILTKVARFMQWRGIGIVLFQGWIQKYNVTYFE